jgi:hypothetical protein
LACLAAVPFQVTAVFIKDSREAAAAHPVTCITPELNNWIAIRLV